MITYRISDIENKYIAVIVIHDITNVHFIKQENGSYKISIFYKNQSETAIELDDREVALNAFNSITKLITEADWT